MRMKINGRQWLTMLATVTTTTLGDQRQDKSDAVENGISPVARDRSESGNADPMRTRNVRGKAADAKR